MIATSSHSTGLLCLREQTKTCFIPNSILMDFDLQDPIRKNGDRPQAANASNSLKACREEKGPGRAPRPSRLQAGEKRKRAVRDVDAEGQPYTVIPTSHIRTLMADRAPLLKAQKRLTKASVRGTLAASAQVRSCPLQANLASCAGADFSYFFLRHGCPLASAQNFRL